MQYYTTPSAHVADCAFYGGFSCGHTFCNWCWAMYLLGWFSNRTGTSFDDGKARVKDQSHLPVSNLPLYHWSSQLFRLRASLSTDIPIQFLNQPVTSALSVKFMRSHFRQRQYGNECNTLKCVRQIAKTVFRRCHTLRKCSFLNSSVHLFGFFLFPLH